MSDDLKTSGFTKENLIRLEQAIAKGIKKVKYTDKEIEYQSMDAMFKARDLIRSCLGLNRRRGSGLFGGTRKNMCTTKGLTCDYDGSGEHGED